YPITGQIPFGSSSQRWGGDADTWHGHAKPWERRLEVRRYGHVTRCPHCKRLLAKGFRNESRKKVTWPFGDVTPAAAARAYPTSSARPWFHRALPRRALHSAPTGQVKLLAAKLFLQFRQALELAVALAALEKVDAGCLQDFIGSLVTGC